MSQFEGDGQRVRCSDCVKFTNKRCSTKGCKVSSKKRRTCACYEFKGEYENRTIPEKIRVPYIDPKTRKLMKKLIRSGVVLSGNSTPGTVPIPSSTATSGLVLPSEEKNSSLIWTPDSENE